MHHFLKLTVLFVVSLALHSAASAQETATGTVFEDTNANGKRDPGENGLPGVHVSNGRAVV